MDVTGTITKVLEKQSGTSAAGKEWVKLSFLIDTKTEYNNLYCFELFGEEKVSNFEKYNKIGDNVKVDFNVKTNEWKDKYFTSLDAWKVFKADGETSIPASTEAEVSDLPF